MPPCDEAATVYALVEIRKYLEREKWQPRYRDLFFFCDWVVHTELDRQGAQNALTVLDTRLANLDLTNLAKPGYDQEVHRFIIFDVLREELARFFAEIHLPDLWTRHPAAWYSVVKHYAEVVRDCALVVPQARQVGRHFRRVVLTDASRIEPDAGKDSFVLVWELTLSDGLSFPLRASITCPPLSSAVWKGDAGPTEMGV
jgi:hypothetical protein